MDGSPSFKVECGAYTLECSARGLPYDYERLKTRVKLFEEIAPQADEEEMCFLGVWQGKEPILFVTQRYGRGPCFTPGVLLVPETEVLFLGAGTRIRAYDLTKPARLWEDKAEAGFWQWNRHGDRVLLYAELEFAAWDIHGRKCWTRFVEPPWDYTVEGGIVTLDIMGEKSTFALEKGPT